MNPQTNIPQALQFEQTVIGAILNEPDSIPEIISILSAKCFYDPRNRQIYQTVMPMYEANQSVDLHTVGQRCNAIPELKAAKIMPYIVSCTQSVASGSHVVSHAQVVKDAFVRRSILSTAHNLIAKVSDDSVDVADTLSFFSQSSDTANESALGGRSAQHISKCLALALKEIENRQLLAQSGKSSGITTGLTELDRITGGWQPSQLTILAARPAMGKTALMLHLAKSADQMGTPVCIYSLEMSDISLANRLLLSECDVEVNTFRSGQLTTQDWHKLEQAAEQLGKLPIYVDDNPTVSMRYIKARSKIMQKRGQCGVIMVDYLQLADTAIDKKNRNREQEIAQASRQAKIIAKELGVPFIMLSQLSRECEKRPDKSPQLSDLRESGAIEQDADIVAFIYRPAYYKIDSIETQSDGNVSTHGMGILNIAKQRDGATGMIAFRHNPSMTKISDFNKEQPNSPDPKRYYSLSRMKKGHI